MWDRAKRVFQESEGANRTQRAHKDREAQQRNYDVNMVLREVDRCMQSFLRTMRRAKYPDMQPIDVYMNPRNASKLQQFMARQQQVGCWRIDFPIYSGTSGRTHYLKVDTFGNWDLVISSFDSEVGVITHADSQKPESIYIPYAEYIITGVEQGLYQLLRKHRLA